MKAAVFHPEALAELQAQAVFYEQCSVEMADALGILAIAPFRRKPAYWRDRT